MWLWRGRWRLWTAEVPSSLPQMAEAAGNVLYYGDNLDVLKRHVKDESVERLP